MAKKEMEEELTEGSSNFKEPVVPSKVEADNKDQNFRVPEINYKYKSALKKSRRRKTSKNSLGSSYDGKQKAKRRSKHMNPVEKASDKNIATLLRSERLFDVIKNGRRIPYDIGYNISKITGFKSVSDLNDYISAHRNKFIVLVARKEKYCQNETNLCNTSLQRTDSVDLDLYFTHHFGDNSGKARMKFTYSRFGNKKQDKDIHQ